MRKISLISIAMLIVSIPTFAGGLLTNTNQHPAFLRMLSRGAKGKAADAKSFHHGVNFIPPRRKFRSTMTEQNFLRVGTT